MGEGNHTEYPWQMSANHYGPTHASEHLNELVAKARAAGFDVQHHPLAGKDGFYLTINGNDNNAYVNKILSRFF